MGSWKLEVFKFALYISFPVGLFYVFNQPQYFEKWVIEKRREMYPPVDEEKRRQFRETITNYRRQRMEKELLEKLENTK
uniref:Protein PET100 homolog, mitochondrial n=1 Tax=Parasteatoda tepidariorum TaxID=114398 RepID=A0A2L2Y7I1_PARTP